MPRSTKFGIDWARAWGQLGQTAKGGMPTSPQPPTALLATLAATYVPSTNHAGPVRILAYGDSLTQGCTTIKNCGANSTTYPYAHSVQRLLDSQHPGVVKMTPIGHVGWMASQMATDLAEHLYGLRPDVVIITAGGNDASNIFKANMVDKTHFRLPNQAERDRIIRDIRKLHSIAHAFGAKTIAMGYPDMHCVHVVPNATNELFKFNRRFEMESGADFYVDLPSLMPHAEVMAKGWQAHDRMHYTRAGHLSLGTRVAPKISQALVKWGFYPSDEKAMKALAAAAAASFNDPDVDDDGSDGEGDDEPYDYGDDSETPVKAMM